MQYIYAIVDNVANDIIGPLWTMKADAVAIRNFGDIASQNNNQVAQHVEDHDLYMLGILATDNGDDKELTPYLIDEKRLVLSGKSWKAAREASRQLELEDNRNG